MYEFYNPHPHGKLVEDCVKRAFTKASGKTYQEVSNELNKIKRDQGAKKYNSNSVWRAYVNDVLKGKKMSFPAKKGEPRMNGHKFCESHPTGTYVLHMAGHLSCCVDGVIYDTWDCLDKCVYVAWLISSPNVEEVDNDDSIVSDAISNFAASGPNRVVICLNGEQIISNMAKLTKVVIQFTKKSEPWIELTQEKYAMVLDALLHDEKYTHLRWKTRRGSKKSTIWDESTGMTLILKNGDKPYLWCTKK